MNMELNSQTKSTYEKCVEDKKIIHIHNKKYNVVFVYKNRLYFICNDSEYGFQLFEVHTIKKSNIIKIQYVIVHYEGNVKISNLYGSYDKAISVLTKNIKTYHNSTFHIGKNKYNKLYLYGNSYCPDDADREKYRLDHNLDFLRAMLFAYPSEEQHQNVFFSKMGYFVCEYQYSKTYSRIVILPKKLFPKIKNLVPDPSIIKKIL